MSEERSWPSGLQRGVPMSALSVALKGLCLALTPETEVTASISRHTCFFFFLVK